MGLGLVASAGTPAGAWAQEAGGSGPGDRSRFTIAPTSVDIRIDGTLDERAWADATRVPLPYEVLPGDNTSAPASTTCFLTFDTSRLYVGCEARDPAPDQIRAFLTDRDDVDGHDRIALVVDPFNDARRAFNFTVTALGVQLDGLTDQQQVLDPTWDAIWESAGRVTATGYVVEAAIPFTSLTFPDAAGDQTWGFYLERQWPRSDRVQMLSMPWDRANACFLCQANLLHGLRDLSPGADIEVTPSLTTTRTDALTGAVGASLAPGTVDPQPALDARWGLSSDLRLNGTVNPDFSQVEADVAQLDVNNRFALFFPEKRPFFLEGADLFQAPERVVLTRTIADPSVGAKLSGKLGRHAVGVLTARDEVTNLLFPGRESSTSAAIERPTTSLIARYRRDVGASSTLGALYTGREGDGYHNRVLGVDGAVQPHPTTRLRVQYAHSETDYPDSLATAHGQSRGPFGGDMAMVRADFATRYWAVDARTGFHSPELRTDAGFIPQVGMKQAWLSVDRIFWGDPGGWFSRFLVRAGYWRREGFRDGLVGDDLWAFFDYTGPLQSAVLVIPRKLRVSFGGEVHDVSDFNVIVNNVQPTADLRLGFVWNVGGGIDVANARRAHRRTLRPSVALRVGSHLDLELLANFQRFSDGGERIFSASVGELRAIYYFDARTFVRGIVQLRHTSRNPAMYGALVAPVDRRVDSQFLFSYKLNPQSVLFVGYDDRREGGTDPALVSVPLSQTRRTFFTKLSFVWRP